MTTQAGLAFDSWVDDAWSLTGLTSADYVPAYSRAESAINAALDEGRIDADEAELLHAEAGRLLDLEDAEALWALAESARRIDGPSPGTFGMTRYDAAATADAARPLVPLPSVPLSGWLILAGLVAFALVWRGGGVHVGG